MKVEVIVVTEKILILYNIVIITVMLIARNKFIMITAWIEFVMAIVILTIVIITIVMLITTMAIRHKTNRVNIYSWLPSPYYHYEYYNDNCYKCHKKYLYCHVTIIITNSYVITIAITAVSINHSNNNNHQVKNTLDVIATSLFNSQQEKENEYPRIITFTLMLKSRPTFLASHLTSLVW